MSTGHRADARHRHPPPPSCPGSGSQRLDHPAHQLNGVGAARLRRPSGESTQRKCPRRGCTDGPMSNAAMRRGSRQPLAGDPALPDPRGTANHNPGRARFGYCGLNESHLRRAPSQRPRQPHRYRVRAQVGSPRTIARMHFAHAPDCEAVYTDRTSAWAQLEQVQGHAAPSQRRGLVLSATPITQACGSRSTTPKLPRARPARRATPGHRTTGAGRQGQQRYPRRASKDVVVCGRTQVVAWT